MMKEQKGITLVALVITIIVLLILAAVSIAALGGNDGILSNASKAKQEDALGSAKDQCAIAASEAIHDYYNYTYAGATKAENVTAGDIAATVAAYINALGTSVPNTNITADKTNGVVIKTTDKSPIQTTATIDGTTGAVGAWKKSEPVPSGS